MSLGNRNYKQIAKIIKESKSKKQIAKELCDYFSIEKSFRNQLNLNKFDDINFMKRCGYES